MPDEEATKPEPTKENKLRDLTPNDDVKGGAMQGKKDDTHPHRRTGEIDFMKGWRTPS